MLICEAFEDLVRVMPDPASYQALCQKVLPSLTGAFDVANVTSDDPLVTVSHRAPHLPYIRRRENELIPMYSLRRN